MKNKSTILILGASGMLGHALYNFLSKESNLRVFGTIRNEDCVFSGEKGNYAESDPADCKTVYGISKYLGEISNQKNVLTIRTSIIGHELRGGHSLVNWFLNQKDVATGYANAIYSGLPTIELAHIIRDLIISNKTLWGLYHIASSPISKFDLLALIAQIYGKKIKLKNVRSQLLLLLLLFNSCSRLFILRFT